MADQPGTEALTAWMDSLRRLRSAAGSMTDPVAALRERPATRQG